MHAFEPPSSYCSYAAEQRRRAKVAKRKADAMATIERLRVKLQSSPKFYQARELKLNEEIFGSAGDRYKIDRLLGKGGMGTIYRARHDDDYVVIKAVDPDIMMESRQLERFILEASTMIHLEHEHLVEGLDFNYTHFSIYYVMEYLNGVTVERMLEMRKAPLEPLEATRIVLQIAQALEYIDYHNLVHRDIKPANILVTTNGKAKLLDFGIAKKSSSAGGVTAKGVIIGTPYYLSPEQVTFDTVDIRSDIYSLGATLFQMVVGTVPFNGQKLVDVLQQRLDYSPDPASFNADLPHTLCQIIHKMMAPKSDQRYASPTKLIAAIKQFLKLAALS